MKNCNILYTKYMENCEAMRSSSHSFAYSCRQFKKCFSENSENSQFLILFLYPICIKFSLFYLKLFTLSIEITWTGFPFKIKLVFETNL